MPHSRFLLSPRFSIGQLPTWAKKKVTESGGGSGGGNSPSGGNPDMPKGRWAQKVHTNSSITFKSHYDTDSVIPFPVPGERLGWGLCRRLCMPHGVTLWSNQLAPHNYWISIETWQFRYQYHAETWLCLFSCSTLNIVRCSNLVDQCYTPIIGNNDNYLLADKPGVESESSKESSLEEGGSKPLPPPRPRRSSTGATDPLPDGVSWRRRG